MSQEKPASRGTLPMRRQKRKRKSGNLDSLRIPSAHQVRCSSNPLIGQELHPRLPPSPDLDPSQPPMLSSTAQSIQISSTFWWLLRRTLLPRMFAFHTPSSPPRGIDWMTMSSLTKGCTIVHVPWSHYVALVQIWAHSLMSDAEWQRNLALKGARIEPPGIFSKLFQTLSFNFKLRRSSSLTAGFSHVSTSHERWYAQQEFYALPCHDNATERPFWGFTMFNWPRLEDLFVDRTTRADLPTYDPANPASAMSVKSGGWIIRE